MIAIIFLCIMYLGRPAPVSIVILFWFCSYCRPIWHCVRSFIIIA